MKEKIKQLSKPLSIDLIDFRIQSINRGGYATILAYKNARADMNVLDNAVGALNWKREHTRDNANCIISIWDNEKGQWVSKEDTGTQSMAEKEKGLASDSFKRAGFNWGIGRELYDYPIISIKLLANKEDPKKGEWYMDNAKPKQGYGLKLKDWKWGSFFEDGKIKGLACRDEKGVVRFNWGTFKSSKGNKKTTAASECDASIVDTY